tara:strand:- start:241 stop:444 length:204 start_codon:yes stop_codon:yes gene_type:complete
MKKKFQNFLEEYLSKLTNSIKLTNLGALEKAATKILETTKKKEQFMYVEMEDLPQYLIIMYVIILNF